MSTASEPLGKARAHLGEVVDRARHGGQPTVLTDHGKPAAVVISHGAYERFRQLQDEEDLRRVRASIASDEAGAPRHVFTSTEDMMRAAGITPEADVA